jgi:hypothetical protein
MCVSRICKLFLLILSAVIFSGEFCYSDSPYPETYLRSSQEFIKKDASSRGKKVAHKKRSYGITLGESQLVGIHLYDFCTRVVDLYGAPNQIESGDAPTETQEEGGAGTPPPGTVAGGSEAERKKEVVFTRWIYRRVSSQYAFVLDRSGRVVQIEAMGLQDPKVRTRKGITLGDNFADIVKVYKAPESYELSETQVIVRYLNKHGVAFRLAKIDGEKPHKVVGIIVSAGKM